jgi:hypothetical protein
VGLLFVQDRSRADRKFGSSRAGSWRSRPQALNFVLVKLTESGIARARMHRKAVARFSSGPEPRQAIGISSAREVGPLLYDALRLGRMEGAREDRCRQAYLSADAAQARMCILIAPGARGRLRD